MAVTHSAAGCRGTEFMHAVASSLRPTIPRSPSCAASWPRGRTRSTPPATWPAEQLRLCGEYGVYQWFAGHEWGGQAWDQESVLRGYLALAGACLTTTFILTQREGACRRIESSRQRAR